MTKIISILCVLASNAIMAAPHNSAFISGHLPSGEDSVTMKVIAEKILGLQTVETVLYTAVTKQGSFSFNIDVPVNYSYITISFRKKENNKYRLVDFFVAFKDSIDIRFMKDGAIFTGRGKEHWQCMYELSKHDTVLWGYDEAVNIPNLKNYEYFGIVQPKFDSLRAVRRKLLDKWRPALNENAYTCINTEVYAGDENRMYNTFVGMVYFHNDSALDRSMEFLEKQILRKSILPPARRNHRSLILAQLLMNRAKLFVRLEEYRKGKAESFEKVVALLKRSYTGILKEKLLAQYILLDGRSNPLAAGITRKIIPGIHTPRYKTILGQFATSKTLGKPAHNFRLTDVNGKVVRLSNFVNKTVVATIWVTGCSFCVGLEKAMKDLKAGYASDTTVVFLAIGVDADRETWMRSVTTGIYTDTLNINLYAKRGQDSFLKFYNVAGYPTQIIIDKKMRLVAYNPPRPVTEENKKVFKEILDKARAAL